MLAPVLAELSVREPDLKIVKINVDEDRDLAVRFDIKSIPTLIVFDGGEEKYRSLGYKTIEDLMQMV